MPMDPPEEVVIELDRRRLFEGRNRCPLRIERAENMFDRAILAARVHALKNNQNGVLFLRIQQGLQLDELLPVSLQFRRRRLL